MDEAGCRLGLLLFPTVTLPRRRGIWYTLIPFFLSSTVERLVER